MALSRVKVWSAGDVLTASDLNAEINNILNNGQSLVQPWVGNFDLDGSALILDGDADTLIDASTDDTIDVTISGADDFRFEANTFTALSGSSVVVASGNVTVTSGNITATAGNVTVTAGALTVTDGATSLTDNDTRTSTDATPLTVGSSTSNSPAAGIGTLIKLQAKSNDENPSDLVSFGGAFSDVGAGTEDSAFRVLLRVAGAALTECWRFVATGAFKGIFTHANSADRTYTFPNYDGTVATIAGTETLTNKTLTSPTITSPTITGNTVGTGALKTSTGSSAFTIPTDVTMNDYSFFPSFTNNDNQNDNIRTVGLADPANTIGRVALPVTSGTTTVRWRYITASDMPEMWVAYDPATGVIKATWASEDPVKAGEAIPGVKASGCVSLRLTAQDLEAFSVLSSRAAEAQAMIQERKWRLQHQAYRALQLLTGDEAPSGWLLANCEIRTANGRLDMKGVR